MNIPTNEADDIPASQIATDTDSTASNPVVDQHANMVPGRGPPIISSPNKATLLKVEDDHQSSQSAEPHTVPHHELASQSSTGEDRLEILSTILHKVTAQLSDQAVPMTELEPKHRKQTDQRTQLVELPGDLPGNLVSPSTATKNASDPVPEYGPHESLRRARYSRIAGAVNGSRPGSIYFYAQEPENLVEQARVFSRQARNQSMLADPGYPFNIGLPLWKPGVE
ncbi:hypothetical protein M8818_003888 [Zalaria obscura]|uniref:Uncharacterized protein n=1 Tax=Zalaria obscura TaxID=2024903 RepID=A0ACC3SEM7_9PEZI